MSDRLREYAERILATVQKQDQPGGPSYIRAGDHPVWALMEPYELASAYLAEHPADDDCPVTQEWLESVGWKKQMSRQGQWRSAVSKWDAALQWYSHDRSLEIIDVTDESSIVIGDRNTRGSVRRLASELGIELMESAHEKAASE